MPELMWKPDPNVDAARKLPTWAAFHRACGKRKLYFDHIVRDGRRGPYRCTAFTTDVGSTTFEHVADGTGKTVIDAIASAFEAAQSRFPVPEARPLLDAMISPATDPLAAMVEGPLPPPDDGALSSLEDMFG